MNEGKLKSSEFAMNLRWWSGNCIVIYEGILKDNSSEEEFLLAQSMILLGYWSLFI